MHHALQSTCSICSCVWALLLLLRPCASGVWLSECKTGIFFVMQSAHGWGGQKTTMPCGCDSARNSDGSVLTVTTLYNSLPCISQVTATTLCDSAASHTYRSNQHVPRFWRYGTCQRIHGACTGGHDTELLYVQLLAELSNISWVVLYSTAG